MGHINPRSGLYAKTIQGAPVEILGSSLGVRCKGHRRPAFTYLSLLVKWPVHENVTSSKEAACCIGVCGDLFGTPRCHVMSHPFKVLPGVLYTPFSITWLYERNGVVPVTLH